MKKERYNRKSTRTSTNTNTNTSETLALALLEKRFTNTSETLAIALLEKDLTNTSETLALALLEKKFIKSCDIRMFTKKQNGISLAFIFNGKHLHTGGNVAFHKAKNIFTDHASLFTRSKNLGLPKWIGRNALGAWYFFPFDQKLCALGPHASTDRFFSGTYIYVEK